jgi:heme A synthase
MYTLVLAIHSWLRWVALIAGVLATYSVATNKSASRSGLVLLIALDVQLLLGLLLYFVLSPFTADAMRDFGAAMRNPGLRFFAVEHVTLMLAAVALVHAGRVMARKATSPDTARVRLLMCFGLATLRMFLAIPWPGMASGRPLFRL